MDVNERLSRSAPEPEAVEAMNGSGILTEPASRAYRSMSASIRKRPRRLARTPDWLIALSALLICRTRERDASYLAFYDQAF
jgi:hypothetical protein